MTDLEFITEIERRLETGQTVFLATDEVSRLEGMSNLSIDKFAWHAKGVWTAVPSELRPILFTARQCAELAVERAVTRKLTK